MSSTTHEQDLRKSARIAGLLYLLIILTAGFAEGFVRAGLVVPGDAAQTAANLLEAPTLFRLGFVADLVAFLADAAVAVLLYVLLRDGHRTIALLAAAFRLIAHPAIGSVNLLNHIGALVVLERGAEHSGSPMSEELALLALELHGYGYVIAGAFFGVHLAILGYLLSASPLFPRILGVLVAIAGAGYLFECYAVFLAPGLESIATMIVTVTAVAGELSLCLYLLFRGVRGRGSPALSTPVAV